MVFLSVNEHLLRILRLGWRGKLKWVRDRLQGADEAGRGVRAPRGRACARRKALERTGFRASREGMVCSPSMLAPARSRCRWVGFGDRLPLETGDRLRGADEAGRGVRAPRGRACARRKAQGRFGFSRFARGMGLFAFNARFGTVPLPLGGFWGQANQCFWGQALGLFGSGLGGSFWRAPRDRAVFGVGRMCNGFIGYSLERLRLWFKLRA